jgi:hypothetical protein
MDKKTRDFIDGTSDIMPIPTGSFLHREKLPNGICFMSLKIPNGDKDLTLKEWWENPNNSAKKDKPPPKHTGGKKPYIMLMVEEIERLKKEGVSNVEELTGHLISLAKHIEWNTGKLIQKRSKKPLKYKDFLTIFGCGNRKLNRLLADMKEYELLYLTDGGYVISSRLIKKGKMNKRRAIEDA